MYVCNNLFLMGDYISTNSVLNRQFGIQMSFIILNKYLCIYLYVYFCINWFVSDVAVLFRTQFSAQLQTKWCKLWCRSVFWSVCSVGYYLRVIVVEPRSVMFSCTALYSMVSRFEFRARYLESEFHDFPQVLEGDVCMAHGTRSQPPFQ
jgi:hypothetical protein